MIEREIISLQSAEGNELKFEKIASIPLDGVHYVVLSPLDAPPGFQDNHALVFRIEEKADGMAALNIVTDTALIAQIYERYHQMMQLHTEELAKKHPSAT